MDFFDKHLPESPEVIQARAQTAERRWKVMSLPPPTLEEMRAQCAASMRSPLRKIPPPAQPDDMGPQKGQTDDSEQAAAQEGNASS